MGYRPTHSDPDVTVISFKANDASFWTKRVDEFLDREYRRRLISARIASKIIFPPHFFFHFIIWQLTTQRQLTLMATLIATTELRLPTKKSRAASKSTWTSAHKTTTDSASTSHASSLNRTRYGIDRLTFSVFNFPVLMFRVFRQDLWLDSSGLH